jgi:hypothetical protein
MHWSGSWRGFWEQQQYGRQLMRDLVLTFTDGKVKGSGVDVIGPFTFEGDYDNEGNVTLVKQYTGRHNVLYQGRFDGEGTIFGRWSISPYWAGPFALSPNLTRALDDGPITDIS